MKGAQLEAGEASKLPPPPGMNRGISILDLILRIVAVGGTLGSAVGMATSDEQLPFFTQFLIYSAEYDDFPTLSNRAKNSRVILILMDTVMLGLLTAAASAASAILYLAHEGNSSANWLAICQQFNDFCQRASGSLIGSFGAIVVLVLLIILSATALSRG